jgi:hypothetical protein
MTCARANLLYPLWTYTECSCIQTVCRAAGSTKILKVPDGSLWADQGNPHGGGRLKYHWELDGPIINSAKVLKCYVIFAYNVSAYFGGCPIQNALENIWPATAGLAIKPLNPPVRTWYTEQEGIGSNRRCFWRPWVTMPASPRESSDLCNFPPLV